MIIKKNTASETKIYANTTFQDDRGVDLYSGYLYFSPMWQYGTLLRELECQKTKIFILVLLLLVTTTWFGLANLSVCFLISKMGTTLIQDCHNRNSTNYSLPSLTQFYLHLKNCTFSQWWLVPKCLPNYIINS